MKPRSFTSLFLALLLLFALPALCLAEDAAAAYKSRCTPCHGADGSGNTPMGKKAGAKSLGSAEVQKRSDTEMQKTITAGQGKMPEFGSKLKPEQVADLVKLIRTFAPKMTRERGGACPRNGAASDFDRGRK